MDDERKFRLAKDLLGLEQGRTPSEEQERLTIAAAELILSDMVGHIARAYREREPGVPAILPNGGLQWISVVEIREDLAKAQESSDIKGYGVFKDLLNLIANVNPDEHVLLAIATKDGNLRIMRIPVDDPSRGIRALVKEWNR